MKLEITSQDLELLDEMLEKIMPPIKCNDCKYITEKPSEWCYMFETPPTSSCAQFTPVSIGTQDNQPSQ